MLKFCGVPRIFVPARAMRVLVLVFLGLSAGCTSTVTTLVPNSYVTTSGADSGTSVSALDLLDESGLTSNAAQFVQFRAKSAGTAYSGYRTYTLPGSITPGSITQIQLLVNYLGPMRQVQSWTWQIMDWSNGGFFTVGDNFFVPDASPWTILTFNLDGNNLANYVRQNDGQIRVRVFSNNTAGDADIDYEALAVTSTSIPVPPGPSFYVSTSGNDTNTGTIALPWRHIAKAASTVGPGSTVYVRGGTYNERVVLQNSGSAAAGFIQFQSFPGENAIIDGTGLTVPASATAAPAGLVQITDLSYVIFQGFEIRNYTANSSNVFPAGISIAGSGTEIRGAHNRIHAISNGINGAHGLAVYGTSGSASLNHVFIDGNELFNLTLGQSESMALNGNVQYWTVTNNVVHDNDNIGIDAIGFEGTAPSTSVDQARDGTISANVVYNINDNNNPAYPPHDNSADGIYVDGGTRIIIERNVLHHDNLGIELASEHSGRVTSHVVARSNLVYLNTAPGISIGGFDASRGSTDHCTIVNNTLFQNDSTPNDGSGEFQMQFFPNNGTVSGNVFENNIVDANSQGVLINNQFTNPAVSLDHNLYFAPNGDPSNNTWVYDNQTFSTFASYQAATGQDSHSSFANPQLLDTSAPVLWVQGTSPAVNAGIDPGAVAVGITDQAGFPRVQGGAIDIGAYEQ